MDGSQGYGVRFWERVLAAPLLTWAFGDWTKWASATASLWLAIRLKLLGEAQGGGGPLHHMWGFGGRRVTPFPKAVPQFPLRPVG